MLNASDTLSKMRKKFVLQFQGSLQSELEVIKANRDSSFKRFFCERNLAVAGATPENFVLFVR